MFFSIINLMRKNWALGLGGLALLGLILFLSDRSGGLGVLEETKRFLGGIFFVDSITDKEIINKYTLSKQGLEKVRVLVVPGHDNEAWGTEFGGIKEAELTLEVAENLYGKLKTDGDFEVFITRDKNGYTPEFANFFVNERENIEKFRAGNSLLMNEMVRIGAVKIADGVPHNFANDETSVKLNGINYWANKNKVDAVISIHFNDYGGRRWNRTGKYSGYAIYVPEKQFSNAKASKTIAQYISRSLSGLLAESDLPKEGGGVVEDQELIATGSNNSLNPTSLLIEYGYIYENQFINPALRPTMMKELAYLTYNGIKNFVLEKNNADPKLTTILPFRWEENLTKKDGGLAVLALQKALVVESLYPPAGFSKNDCPMSGIFGSCTEKATVNFQKKYGIYPAEGVVGPATREKLNSLYGSRVNQVQYSY